MNVFPEDALEVCLAALESGVDIESCLNLYPDLAEDLRPPLEAAKFVRSMGSIDISQEAANRSRTRMLALAAQLRQKKAKKRNWFAILRNPRLAVAALLMVIILVFGWGGLVSVSAKSLPGDTLYPIKRVVENLNSKIAPSFGTRQTQEVERIERRLSEAKNLLNANRVEDVTLIGLLSEQSPNEWFVNDLPIILTPETEVGRDVAPGMLVRVEAETKPDGSLLAFDIQPYIYAFSGRVELIKNQEWVVSGDSVGIVASTQIDPAARVGDWVIIMAEHGMEDEAIARAIVRLYRSDASREGEVEFIGVVEFIDTDLWKIGGQTVRLTLDTEIKDQISTGDWVKVEGHIDLEGSLTADEIELSEDFQIENIESEDASEEDLEAEQEGIDDQDSEEKEGDDEGGLREDGDEESDETEDRSLEDGESIEGDDSNENQAPNDEDDRGDGSSADEDEDRGKDSGSEDDKEEEDRSDSNKGSG